MISSKQGTSKTKNTRSFEFRRVFTESIAIWGQCKSEHTFTLKMYYVIIHSLENCEKQSERTVDKIPAEIDYKMLKGDWFYNLLD